MSAEEPTAAGSHRETAEAARDRSSICCAVLTISDTRTPENDASGDAITMRLEAAGFGVPVRSRVPDDTDRIESQIEQWLGDPAVHVVITTGGTGIAQRDNTVDVARKLIAAELEGFGELFRMLSYEEVGSSAMLSRCVGGLVSRTAKCGGDTFLFALPGSTNAVTLAMDKLIVPELPHLVWQRQQANPAARHDH